MKIKFTIKKDVPIQADVLENKIEIYLKTNFYRVVERGPGFVIFIDDEYSGRKRYRSDYHTRIGQGKFEFKSVGQGTSLRLIYFTNVLYAFFIMMLFIGMGIYTNLITPIIFSMAFALPIFYKIYYLNQHVFKEILEC